MSAIISPAQRKRTEERLNRNKARYVTVAAVDHFGQLRGQIMNRDAFRSTLSGGVPFLPAAQAALDVGDQILVAPGVLDMNMPFADEPSRVVVESPRQLPFYPDHANQLFFAECTAENSGYGYDTRQLYRRAEARLHSLGLTPVQGFEYEMRLYRESAQSAIDKGFDNLVAFNATSGYMNVLHQAQSADFLFGLLDTCETLDVPVAGMHHEHGIGMLEAALGPARSITAPENAVLFKTFTKVYAARNGTLASFMAKPNAEEDGGSLHTHISLVTRKGRNAFYAAREPHGISKTMRHFIGGLLEALPDLFVMAAPNPNSMRRFVIDHFAPVAATWGVQNRTAAVRIVPGGRNSQRIEFRVPGADANPFLVLALVLAAGARGIENQIEPGPMVEGSTYTSLAKIPKELRFPGTFRASVQRFQRSSIARELFGDLFVDAFAGARKSQLDEMKGLTGKAAWRAERERFLIGI